MIDIEGMDKAEILRKLFNASKPQGWGFLQNHSEEMTIEEAREIIETGGERKNNLYFDYVRGRVLKVDLSGTELDPRKYDRDNGSGAALAALNL